MDWFNPFLNKTSGKTVSAGSVAFACLNLPPSLRYATHNIYLFGVLPGPREPSGDEVNHFLALVVDTFLHSYNHGTWFSQTYERPRGALCRSAIAVNVNDLIGARKISGHAGISAHLFCAFCSQRKKNINNLDHTKWAIKTYAEVLKAAEVRWT